MVWIGEIQFILANCFGRLSANQYMGVDVTGNTVQDGKIFRSEDSTSTGVGYALIWNDDFVGIGDYGNALDTATTLEWPGSTGGVDLSALGQTAQKPVSVGVYAVRYGTEKITGGMLNAAINFSLSIK